MARAPAAGAQSRAVRITLRHALWACALSACAAQPSPFTARPDAAADAALDAALDAPPAPLDVPGFDLAPRDLGPPRACERVDLLFVIDSSGSMGDNQRSLARSVPGFLRAMRARLDFARSVNVGVVTSSDYFANADGCGAIGSLITRTGGPESSNRNCQPFASGARYLTHDDPDLDARFACIAQVGAGGSDDERMMRALLTAVRPEANLPGRCNSGFLRRDSLLVVVLITDEDDVPDGCDGTGACMTQASGGTPQEWFDQVLAARSNLSQNVVVLSLLGLRGDNACGAVPAARLIGFTRRFGANGFTGDVCADDYAPFFDGALGVIERACANFVTPP
jgi:hypothetical protein